MRSENSNLDDQFGNAVFLCRRYWNRSEVNLYPVTYIDLQVNRSSDRLVDDKEKILSDRNVFAGAVKRRKYSHHEVFRTSWSHPRGS
jgi:hypothetical protein